MSVESLMLDLGMNLESQKGTTMKYVFIVVAKNGFIFGAYANRDDAQAVFASLAHLHPDLRLSQEPLLQKAAHYRP